MIKLFLIFYSVLWLTEAGLLDDSIKEMLERLREEMSKGLPQWGIESLNPLILPSYTFQPISEQIQLRGYVDGVRIDNLPEFQITEVKSNLAEESLNLSLKWDKDIKVTMKDYSVEGNLMKTIPVNGKGSFKLLLQDFGIDMLITVDKDERVINTMELKFTGETQFDVRGLGKGFTDNINNILNKKAISTLNKMSPLISVGLVKFLNEYIEESSSNDISVSFIESFIPKIPINNILDPILADLRVSLMEQGVMPIGLPGDEVLFTVDIFDSNLNCTMAIYGGEVRGLDTLHRTGDASFNAIFKPNLKVTIGVNNLAVAYYALLKCGILGTDVGIDLTISHLQMYAEMNVVTDIEIVELTIPEVGSLQSKVKMLSILDPFLNLLLDSVLNMVGDALITPLADIIKQILNNLLASNPQFIMAFL